MSKFFLLCIWGNIYFFSYTELRSPHQNFEYELYFDDIDKIWWPSEFVLDFPDV